MRSKVLFHDLKIEIPVKTGFVVRYYGELMYILFDKPYCWLHFADKSTYKIEIGIQYMSQNLPIAFFQCNKSVIINLCYGREYDFISMIIRMEDGKKIELARRRVKNFNETKQNLSRLSPPCTNCYICTHDECKNRVIFTQSDKTQQNNGHQKSDFSKKR